jgi:hypothetical protein
VLKTVDISAEQRGEVAVHAWNEGENRVNLDSLGRIDEILDELEARGSARRRAHGLRKVLQ